MGNSLNIEEYPNTEVYYVCYTWGSGGSFISSLIYDLVIAPSNLPFSDTGDSHLRVRQCEDNWIIEPGFEHVEGKRGMLNYSNISPKNAELPLIIYSHVLPDYENLFKKYSKCKLIIITITTSDVTRVKLNSYNKVFKKDENKVSIHNIAGVSKDYLNVELPPQNNIFLIPFSDIYKNKNKVLLTLQQITNRPVTADIIKTYNDYLDIQKRLYNQ